MTLSCAGAVLLFGIGGSQQAGALDPPPPELRASSFETSLDQGIDFDWRVDSPFSVTRTSEAGAPYGDYAAKIVTNGGNWGCSCPRMTFLDGFSLRPGDEFWMGGFWRIPEPSKLAWSRLMNLGHFESSDHPDNWLLGLLVREPGELQVIARRYQSEEGQSVLMAPRPIPKDRWFAVHLHVKLSPVNGEALTEVYLDGELVASTAKRNMLSGGPLHFYNAGLPYFWPGNGNTTVYFDTPWLVY